MLEVPYKDVDFVFVSGHYDFHRSGICRHNGELAQFTCSEEYPDDYGSCGDDCYGCPKCDYSITCTITPLTRWQKVWWVYRKKLFELCVSRHWSYPRVEEKYIRLPSGVMCKKRSVFKKMLFAVYYLPAKSPKRWIQWIRQAWKMG